MGITLDNISYSGGASVKRIHRPHDGSAVGTYLVDGLLRNIHEKEIPLFVNADVKKINEKDGKVTGVSVKSVMKKNDQWECSCRYHWWLWLKQRND